MVDKITQRQYEEIEEAFTYGSIEEFHRILAEHTGISTASYTGYHILLVKIISATAMTLICSMC